MTSPDKAGRRSFLKGSIAIVPVAAVGTASAVLRPTADEIKRSAPPPDTPAQEHYQPAYFTPDEWAFVNAACDCLIPKDHVGPGAVELGVPQYIDRQLQTGYGDASRWYMHGPFHKGAPEFGYQSKLTPKEQYRLGIRAIDAYCKTHFGDKTFAQLDKAKQIAFLKDVEGGKIQDDFNLKSFFSGFLLKNTMEGYFGDPMYGGNKDMGSWKMIGYPGARADYVEWVSESKPYPYGPVSQYGKRG